MGWHGVVVVTSLLGMGGDERACPLSRQRRGKLLLPTGSKCLCPVPFTVYVPEKPLTVVLSDSRGMVTVAHEEEGGPPAADGVGHRGVVHGALVEGVIGHESAV